jgi:hypothetical protein
MNEKQAKLVRYFVKHTHDFGVGKSIINSWPRMNAKAKGKVTTWMKKVIVTMMAIKDLDKKREVQAKLARTKSNLEVLKGFVNA